MKALVSIFVIGIPIYFFSLYMSHAVATEQIAMDRLTACPSKPNCVCSECERESEHYVAPIIFSEPDVEKTNESVLKILKSMGAEIAVNESAYIAATFTSSAFRFVDDFEVQIDVEKKIIHVRSASRVGYSDFGVNRKRVEKFRRLIQK